MTLFDTHCHIHSADYPLLATDVEDRARQAGVLEFLCVGTDASDSALAVAFARSRRHAWASVGIHPHETNNWEAQLPAIEALLTNDAAHRIVAIGECGLDYHYTHAPKEAQQVALQAQLDLAVTHQLPVVFHVREAFDDLWPILSDYPNVRGVMHSFTDSPENLRLALDRGFYIGVNGIATFGNDLRQDEVVTAIPLDRLLLETDAPFLTPKPFRGKVNELAHIRTIAEYLSTVRQLPLEQLAAATTANAHQLFLR